MNRFIDVPGDCRTVASMTVSLSPQSYTRVKELTAEFHKAVLREVRPVESEDILFRINMQMFPLNAEKQYE